jgi:2-methylcitrate dehydratase PrpD
MADEAIEQADTGEQGRLELEELARYATAPVDAVLAGPETAIWAAARLLDGLGNIAHGFDARISKLVREAAPRQQGAAVAAWPDAEPGYREDDAAFLLGVYAFSENYCDTGLASVAHLGSIVVPSVLLAAQHRELGGREVLAAITVGYNVMEYFGATLNGGSPRMAHQLRGFRPTASAGPLAAVAVLARLSGASAEECCQAMALACSQGGGLRRSPQSAVGAIRIQSGEALRRAVQTLWLAKAGVASDTRVLRLPGGFFPAYAGGKLLDVAVPKAGADRDFLATASMKLDCTPHTLVTLLDATRDLGARHRGRIGDWIDDIASVVVSVPAQHNVISGGGKPLPDTFAEAAGHVPFCVALALVSGSHLYPAVLEAGITDEVVRALAERVTLVVDDELTTIFDSDATSWPARVEIEFGSRGRDTAELRAPETSDWTAEHALSTAAEKVTAIMGERAGTADELAAYFAGAARWPDAWAAIVGSPLTRPAAVRGAR